jgi:hypothetical protein
MKIIPIKNRLRDAPRLLSLLLFEILALFWVIKAGYCVYGYLTNGISGVREAILRHATNPYNLSEWGRGQPRWDLIAMRYVFIAVLTILLGFANRRTLRKFWEDLHQPPQPKYDS